MLQQIENERQDNILGKTCSRCKHWINVKGYDNHCRNDEVLDMIESYEGVYFETKPDFGCNHWESK